MNTQSIMMFEKSMLMDLILTKIFFRSKSTIIPISSDEYIIKNGFQLNIDEAIRYPPHLVIKYNFVQN
jgi:hypothetical protein